LTWEKEGRLYGSYKGLIRVLRGRGEGRGERGEGRGERGEGR